MQHNASCLRREGSSILYRFGWPAAWQKGFYISIVAPRPRLIC